MSISTDDWMRLLDSVTGDLNIVSDPEMNFFFWQKYCSLQTKVRFTLKNLEREIFSGANDILQRIFSHRTQEYDGADAKIGIPMAFQLSKKDYYATFTYEGSSYADFYYFNRYRVVDAIEGTEEGDVVSIYFEGRPVGEVVSIADMVQVKAGDETISKGMSDLVNVDRDEDIEEGSKVVLFTNPAVRRTYRCKVLELMGEKMLVKILRHQGYPDDLVRELSYTRVTMTELQFKKQYDSAYDSVEGSLQLVENAIKYLGRDKIRLSRTKKSTIRDKLDRYEVAEVALENDLFADLDIQSNKIDDDNPGDFPSNYLIVKPESFGVGEAPKKRSWFKNPLTVDEIRPKFLKALRVMTTLDTLKTLFTSKDYLEKRIRVTIEKIVLGRDRVNLKKDFKMLVDLQQLYNYAYESVRDDYEEEQQNLFIREHINSIVFDKTKDDISISLEDPPAETAESSDYDTDEEEVLTRIPDKNANTHSDYYESQLIQWPVGEFKYWEKIKDVIDTLLQRDRNRERIQPSGAVIVNGDMRLRRYVLSGYEDVFTSRLECMLTSNGRLFLEENFEQSKLPSKRDLLDIYNKLRPSLNDIFLILTLKHYLSKKANSKLASVLEKIIQGLIKRFFSGLNITFFRDSDKFIDSIFYDESINLNRNFYMPLVRKLAKSGRSVAQRTQVFKKRLESIQKQRDYTAICLNYVPREVVEVENLLNYYLARAMQCGVYLTKYFKTSRQSSQLYFELLGILFDINASKPADFDKDGQTLQVLDAEIKKNLFLKRNSRTRKDEKERKAQYHRDRRDSIFMKHLKAYIDAVNKKSGERKRQFRTCDALTSLIAINAVASFENSNLDDLLQTTLVNFLERGTLDLGTYAQMWFFQGNSIENHWIRCKDKTTVEVMSVSRFAEIDSRFCMFNVDDWDLLVESHVFLMTPNSKWGEVKGYNCNAHNLYMSYDVESTKASQAKKRIKEIQNFNTLHNPVRLHREQLRNISLTAFQKEALQKKTLTGVAWSIGNVLGQTVVHIGSEFFLTFNNIFGCLSNKNYMPFEKFKYIGQSGDYLQNQMYDLFAEVYNARYDEVKTGDDMRTFFMQNVGSIKSNYESLNLETKLPRHNYVVRVLEFLEILDNLSNLQPSDDTQHLLFIIKVCKTLLKELPDKLRRKIGATITVEPLVIKSLGEMFYSQDIEEKIYGNNPTQYIWSKKFNWRGDSKKSNEDKESQMFRIQRLVELVLLVDFATMKQQEDYRFRFHERLNKLNLAFSYKLSGQRDWAKEHKYFDKLRKKNVLVDCSLFYLEIPQCKPIVEFCNAYDPSWNYEDTLYKTLPGKILDLLDFDLRGKDDKFVVSLPFSETKENFANEINSVVSELNQYLEDLDFYINYDVENAINMFSSITPFTTQLKAAELELREREQSRDEAEDSFKASWDELVQESEEKVRSAKELLQYEKFSLARQLFDFWDSINDFSEYLITLKNGLNSAPEFECSEVIDSDAELRTDILDSLSYPYIRQLYGEKLLTIVNADLFVNGPQVVLIAEKIIKSISKRLEVLESDDTPNEKVGAILRTDKEDDIERFLSENDLSKLTEGLRELHDTLEDYFDDFDVSPILTRLEMTRIELVSLYDNAGGKDINPILKILYEQDLEMINFYIDIETLISNMLFAGGPYINFGKKVFTALRGEIRSEEDRKSVEDIFGEDEIEDPVLVQFKDRYSILPTVKSQEERMKQTFNQNRIKEVQSQKLSDKETMLKDFIKGLSVQTIYDKWEEEFTSDEAIVLESLKTFQPAWFETLKADLSKELERLLQQHVTVSDEDDQYDEDISYFNSLVRLWNKIKTPSNRKLFKRFCDKVMESNDTDVRERISTIIRNRETELEDFFNIIFRKRAWLEELIIDLRRKNWLVQLKSNFRGSIRTEHITSLNECVEKMNLMRNFRSTLFTQRFKDFYNTLVSLFQENMEFDYLLEVLEPFVADIELHTGFDINLALPVSLESPWFNDMKNRLIQKINELNSGSGTSSDDLSPILKPARILSASNLHTFLQNLNLATHTRKEEINNIIQEYQQDISEDIGELTLNDGRLELSLVSSDSARSSSSSDDSSSSDSGESGSDESPVKTSIIPSSDKSDDMDESLDVSLSSEDIEDMEDIDQTFREILRGIASVFWDENKQEIPADTEFKKHFLDSVANLCSKIRPSANEDLIHGDNFSSALGLLKKFILDIHKHIGEPDLEFLSSLENIAVPLSFRHLQYMEQNKRKNLYFAMKDLLEEVIAGEFSWPVIKKVDEEISFKKVQTFRSYILNDSDLDLLREYERNYGLQGTFRERLAEAKESADAGGEEKSDAGGEEKSDTGGEEKTDLPKDEAATVYTVPYSLVAMITRELLSTFKMTAQKFTVEDKDLLFTNVKTYQALSDYDRNNATYKGLVGPIVNMKNSIFDTVQKDLENRIRVFNVDVVKDWPAFRNYVNKVTENLMFQYAAGVSGQHVFIWGLDLNCVFCGKSLLDEIHLEESTVTVSKIPASVEKMLEVYSIG